MRYIKKREYVWSVDIAYSVGLMASDGCLSSDGRHLDLTSVDIDQLENFRRAIGKAHLPIRKKSRATNTNAYHFQFSDVAYYDFLIDAGLTPAKSKTLQALDIPANYFRDFLRGFFDGDGSCNAYYDLRWRNSYMFYVHFACASKPFLEYLHSEIASQFGTKGGTILLKKGVFSLSYAKADARKIYTAMYQDASVFLARKKIKLEGFIKTDKDVTISRLNARVL